MTKREAWLRIFCAIVSCEGVQLKEAARWTDASLEIMEERFGPFQEETHYLGTVEDLRKDVYEERKRPPVRPPKERR